jgi:hypothetical protein
MNWNRLLPSLEFLRAAALGLSCAIILCLVGVWERRHPDEYHIPFNTPLAQPDDITCGPASAAMLLHHYGNKVTVREVEKYTKTKWLTYQGKDIGTTAPDALPVALNHFGLPAQLKFGSPDTLKHYLAQNKPCIVLVRSGEAFWHYVLVVGFTPASFSLADPAEGRVYEMPSDVFVGCWSWAKDMDGTPRSSLLSNLLQAADIYPYTLIVPDRPAPR